MALYSSFLVAKWRKTIASDTPAAMAISFVVAPPKPRCENNRIATRRICSRRSPPAMRAPLTVAPLLVVICVLRGRKRSPPAFEVSTHLPLARPDCQAVELFFHATGPALLSYG